MHLLVQFFQLKSPIKNHLQHKKVEIYGSKVYFV